MSRAAALRLAGSALAAAPRAAAQLVLAMVVWSTAITLLPLAFGWRPWLVVSDSMQPRLKPGDVVLGAPATQVQVGNVVLFAAPDSGRTVIHRVVRREPDGSIVTRGDANQSNDPTPVPAGSIDGLGRLRVPMIGLPAYWQRQGQWGQVGAVATGVLGLLVLAGHHARPAGARPKHRRRRADGQARPAPSWLVRGDGDGSQGTAPARTAAGRGPARHRRQRRPGLASVQLRAQR